jgi:hypothetical protein
MPVLKRIEDGDLTATLEQKSERAVIESLEAIDRMQKKEFSLLVSQ